MVASVDQDSVMGLVARGIIRHTMPLTAGAKLDGYEVVGLLGAGGMGEVYRARDSVLKREVAIKVLPSFVSQDPDRLRRFEQEAQAAAALNHPNILAVHRFGTFEGTPYLVSELLEGETLRQQMERGPLPIRKAIDYGVQIANGLAAAHDKGIVHRDLKPENLFVTKGGRIKILDFGLAKLMQSQPDPDGSAPTQARGTDPGMVMGTAGYMSPEQVRGNAVDHRTDIFAFGAILYEMLTGTRAFHRSTSAETMTAILNDDPPAISQVVQTTPPGLQRVVHRCLEKNPEQRFHSASDLAFALEALSESGSVPAVAASGAPNQRRRSKVLIWSGGVVALLTLAAAAYLVVASRNSVPPLRVSAYTQITHDGHAKQLKGTDGSRLYFDQDPTTIYRPGCDFRRRDRPGPGGGVCPGPGGCFPGWVHFSRHVIYGRPAESLPPVECSDPGWFGPPSVGSRGCGLESRRKHGCLLNRGRRYPPHSERWRGGSEVGLGWKPGYFDLLVARRQDHPIYEGPGPLGNVFQRV